MDKILTELRSQVLQHVDDNPERAPLGGMGIFHCITEQKLREIPIYAPSVVLVLAGNKHILVNEKEQVVPAGELLLLPSNFSLWMDNQPDQQQAVFLSLAMGFSVQALETFRKLYAAESNSWNNNIVWHSHIPENIALAFTQWFHWCRQHPIDDTIALHRQVEILLLLTKAGLAANLLHAKHPQWKARIAQIINMNLPHAWKIQEICDRLNVSESTLRRHLQDESTSFREILEENRLVAGLSLLQETCWTISRVAQTVGYQSQSRFSERFKQRFGMTPSALKKTRQI